MRPLSAHYLNLYDEDLKELRIKTKPASATFLCRYAENLEEIQESERKYLNAYFKANTYRLEVLLEILRNIVVKGRGVSKKRSELEQMNEK